MWTVTRTGNCQLCTNSTHANSRGLSLRQSPAIGYQQISSEFSLFLAKLYMSCFTTRASTLTTLFFGILMSIPFVPDFVTVPSSHCHQVAHYLHVQRSPVHPSLKGSYTAPLCRCIDSYAPHGSNRVQPMKHMKHLQRAWECSKSKAFDWLTSCRKFSPNSRVLR